MPVRKGYNMSSSKQDRKIYKPVGKVCRAFLESNAETKSIMGPVGSGKTSAYLSEIWKTITKMPVDKNNMRKYKGAIIRNSKDDLKKTTMEDIIDWTPFPDCGETMDKNGGHFFKTEMTYKIYIRPFHKTDGTIQAGIDAEIYLIALEDLAQVRKLRSLPLTQIFFEEAQYIKWEFIRVGLERTGRFPHQSDFENGFDIKWSRRILVTNPPPINSTLHKLWEYDIPASRTREENGVGKAIEWDHFKQPSGLSPEAENTENLTKDYYERIMWANQNNPDYVNNVVHGEYAIHNDNPAVFGLAFNIFTHTLDHTQKYEPLDITKTVYCGVDFGFHPAFVYAYIDNTLPAFPRLIVFKEIFFKGEMEWRIFLNHVKQYEKDHLNGYNIERVGDPAGNQRSSMGALSPIIIAHREGIKIQTARTNEIKNRITIVSDLLRKRTPNDTSQILIDPNGCKYLYDGFQGEYQYENGLPSKNIYSHVQDAFAYLLLSKRPIQNLTELFPKQELKYHYEYKFSDRTNNMNNRYGI